MFEHFTNATLLCFECAAEEAERLADPTYSTYILLLGVLRTKDTAICPILLAHGIDLARTRAEVEALIGKEAAKEARKPAHSYVEEEIPFTGAGKLVVQRSIAAAEKLGGRYVEPIHLLIGILEVAMAQCSTTLQALTNLGIDAESLKNELELLGHRRGETCQPG